MVHHQYLVGRDAELSGAETQRLGHILMHSNLNPSFSLLSLRSLYEATLMVFLPLPSSQLLWILQQIQILIVLKVLNIVTEFVTGMFICVACFVCVCIYILFNILSIIMYLKLNFAYTYETMQLPEFRKDTIDIVS